MERSPSRKRALRKPRFTRRKMGFIGFTQEQFKVFIGPPLFDSFRTVVGMTDEQANRAIDYYHERFERVGWAENEVYAGIPALLRSLKKNGARVAIVTAKPQIFAERIAKKFGFAPYLDDVIGPGLDNKDSSKAALVRRGVEAFGGSVVMVGDRPLRYRRRPGERRGYRRRVLWLRHGRRAGFRRCDAYCAYRGGIDGYPDQRCAQSARRVHLDGGHGRLRQDDAARRAHRTPAKAGLARYGDARTGR